MSARLLLDLKDSNVDELPYSIAMSLLGPLPYELTLRKALDANGELARTSAVLAFSFLPLESARARLFEHLSSDTLPLSRAHAAVGLMLHESKDISDNQAKNLIRAAERGPDEWVRGYSTLALGKFAHNRDVALALEKQLDNSNIQFRAMAAFSMGINRYPRGVQLLKKKVETEKSYAVLADIVSLGMFKHRMFVPYFSSGIKYSGSDPERLAFASALASSIETSDYPKIVELLSEASSVDKKTYAWTLGLHGIPGSFAFARLRSRCAASKRTTTPWSTSILRLCAVLWATERPRATCSKRRPRRASLMTP
ncbi:MAG: HEAT repeat domain-containing protein [Planctomycetota bacterium]|nr:HEAT repeat domain-containing protein [Planctomycetota bacterium]